VLATLSAARFHARTCTYSTAVDAEQPCKLHADNSRTPASSSRLISFTAGDLLSLANDKCQQLDLGATCRCETNTSCRYRRLTRGATEQSELVRQPTVQNGCQLGAVDVRAGHDAYHVLYAALRLQRRLLLQMLQQRCTAGTQPASLRKGTPVWARNRRACVSS